MDRLYTPWLWQHLLGALAVIAALSGVVFAQSDDAARTSEAALPSVDDLASSRQQAFAEAQLAHRQQEWPRAIEHLERVADMDMKLHGDFSVELAATQELLAQWYMDDKRFSDARTARTRVLEIYQAKLGSNHWRTKNADLSLKDIDTYEIFSAEQFQRLAELERRHARGVAAFQKGDFRTALEMAEQNCDAYADLMGTKHANYAVLLDTLAAVHVELANYAKVEQLLELGLSIQEQLFGRLHPGVAGAEQTLGRFSFEIGDFDRAEHAFRSSWKIKQQLFGPTSPRCANTLHSLSAALWMQGKHDEAVTHLKQCRQILETPTTANASERARLLGSVANLLWEMDRKNEAALLFRQVAALKKSIHGANDPQYAAAILNVAEAERAAVRLKSARETCSTACNILRNALGEEHPLYARALSGLAAVAVAEGDLEMAEQDLHRALEISTQLMDLATKTQSERQELAMRSQFRSYLDQYLSLAIRYPDAIETAYSYVLIWKGAGLARNRSLRAAAIRPEIRPLLVELQANAGQLSAWKFGVANASAAQRRDAIDALLKRQDRLERQLARAGAPLVESRVPRHAALMASLPAGSTLIDMIQFVDVAGDRGGANNANSQSHFAAFILSHDQPLQMIRLGNADEIAGHVTVWRAAEGNGKQAEQAAQQLKRVVWEPIAASTNLSGSVLVSPDGVLGAFPLAALPGKASNSYLIEDCRMALVPALQFLLGRPSRDPKTATQSPLLIVGGVNYDSPLGLENRRTEAQVRTSHQDASGLGLDRLEFDSLAGSATEVAFIRQLHAVQQAASAREAVVLEGDQATESAFCQHAPTCRVLHVSTHGFFRPQNRFTLGDADLEAHCGMSLSRGRTANVMSGLAFAGANHRWHHVSRPQPGLEGIDDGVLTASEIAALDLSDVELVVLSACETGLGEVAQGEGLLGLQRAFQLAGAKATIATLWSVDDQATQLLMEEFYRNYFQRELSATDALHAAQLWALKHMGDQLTATPTDTSRGPRRASVGNTDSPATKLPAKYWAGLTISIQSPLRPSP